MLASVRDEDSEESGEEGEGFVSEVFTEGLECALERLEGVIGRSTFWAEEWEVSHAHGAGATDAEHRREGEDCREALRGENDYANDYASVTTAQRFGEETCHLETKKRPRATARTARTAARARAAPQDAETSYPRHTARLLRSRDCAFFSDSVRACERPRHTHTLKRLRSHLL